MEFLFGYIGQPLLATNGLIDVQWFTSENHPHGIPTSDAHRSPVAGRWPGATPYSGFHADHNPDHQALTPLLLAFSQIDHRTFIHAMAILHARSVFARATIIGGDNQRQLIKTIALADALSLQNYVQFESAAGNVIDQYRAFTPRHNHIIAVTCTDKNMAEVVSESMVAGYAVIAVADVNGLIDDAVTGYNVSSLDAQTLADVSENLLRNPARARTVAQTASARHSNNYRIFRRA